MVYPDTSIVNQALSGNSIIITPALQKAVTPEARTPNNKRLLIAISANAVLWTGSFVALNKAWYAGYPRSSFHFFNDNSEWNQMDKAGHMWTAYQVSRVSGELWKWTGLNTNKAAVLGGLSGIMYQGIIEVQDGFSSEWGFSWGDLAANTAGAAAFVLQQTGWKDQRIQIKMSYWPYHYRPEFIDRRNQLFGKTIQERMLKDYNSQTYWLSMNMSAFLPGSNLPRWLNLSVGYGSNGLLGANSNRWRDKQGDMHERNDVHRVRRLYISPDIDLTRIRTKSRILRSVFFVLNSIKIPAPAIEFNSMGKLRVHALHF